MRVGGSRTRVEEHCYKTKVFSEFWPLLDLFLNPFVAEVVQDTFRHFQMSAALQMNSSHVGSCKGLDAFVSECKFSKGFAKLHQFHLICCSLIFSF